MAQYLRKSNQHQLVDEWYRQFKSKLAEFLRRGVRSDADVQDLSQEVFLRLLRVKQPELIEAPRAYLYRIAVHVLAEWRTREGRARMHDSEELDDLSTGGGPDQTAESDSQRAELQQALSHLPASYRATLVLHTQHRLTYREIAQHLGVTERMVKRYIVKGYAEMRQRLSHTAGDHNGRY